MTFETAITIFSLVLIGIAFVRFSSIGLSSTRQQLSILSWKNLSQKKLRQAAELARLNSQIQNTKKGQDWRVMEVAEIAEESADCKSFYLVDPYGQKLPAFLPGQFLMVRPALAGNYQTTRCYSLSSSPDSRYYRITVKRQLVEGSEQANNRLPQEGGLSQWLHDTIHPGDCLLISGPSGSFHLPSVNEVDSSKPLVLLGAGVGVTPVASMLRWTLQNHPERPVYVFLQARDLEHWPLGRVLHEWQNMSRRMIACSYFSREDDSFLTELKDVPGCLRAGKYDASELRKTVHKYPWAEYYMCGPDPWMTALQADLAQSGVPTDHIHWESFGVAAETKQVSDIPPSGYQVDFAKSHCKAQWDDPEVSLWELARASDVDIPSGCLSGVCGSCRANLVQGQVDYSRKVGVDLSEGECLTCIARPVSDVVLDV